MHDAGFDWICDIAYVNGNELVASKYKDCDKRIHKHKEERIKNPPQPAQERARYFGLKFRL